MGRRGSDFPGSGDAERSGDLYKFGDEFGVAPRTLIVGNPLFDCSRSLPTRVDVVDAHPVRVGAREEGIPCMYWIRRGNVGQQAM
jgi:hypothetical protein